ncbi:MAG: PAS domain-containing sensor histidine kinase [Pseudomonadota bacterium]
MSVAAIVGGVSMVGALLSAITTFVVLTGLSPVRPTGLVIAVLVVVNIAFVIGLTGCILSEVFNLVRARRRGTAGARLHVRIVGLFAIVAAVPAVLVALVAIVTLERGLDAWFSERTQAIVDTSLTVANAYVSEHGQVIRSDLLAMANEINRAHALYERQPEQFQQVFDTLASIRAFAGAYILDGNGEILVEMTRSDGRDFQLPPPGAVEPAREGQVVLIAPGVTDYVGGFVFLPSFDDAFLFVVRAIDERVIGYLRLTQANVEEYQQLRQRRAGSQIAFGMAYFGVTLTLLLAAVWVGIGFANRLVAPIRLLIGASREVARGNLDARVPAHRSEGDLSGLTLTFNQMTSELKSQRNELLTVNREMDDRRRFIETVLAGVPAGVIGVDAAGRITIANRTARELVGAQDVFGKPIVEALPEISDLVQQAELDRSTLVQDQVSITRGGKERIVAIRVAPERSDPADHSLVVTLDDITDLIQAQRTSAWADVARRIAHEIKNPLTPIQLSAERLKRKYGRVITDDRDVFDQCTDTIIRQVGDIGRMVDEFSTFARMPKPSFSTANVATVVRETVFMMQVANPDLEISLSVPEEPVTARFDARLVAQALTNIIKNATEAIAAIERPDTEDQGRIDVRLRDVDGKVQIDVIDNGIGLPTENRHRLLEPYVTHREKGTGLGLAIVRRILEEHDGTLDLTDAPAVASGGRGALVRLSFPIAANGGDETDDNHSAGRGPSQTDAGDISGDGQKQRSMV